MATNSTTKYYYLSGEISWPKFEKPDPKYDVYSVQIKLDEASEKVYQTTGLKLRPKEDGSISIRRKPISLIKGVETDIGPPVVLNADNTPFNFNSARIGNGTKATLKVSVYPTKMGPGHRLLKVRIDELIPYTGGGDAPF